MNHHDPSPHTLPQLRRAAHEFLCRYAALAWADDSGGEQWQIFLPPEIQRLPERKRYRAHARHEAQRLTDAALYELDLDTTRRAVQLGATIREHRHHNATAATDRLDVVDTMNIHPPHATGFLRWRDPHGIGYNTRGAPFVACHWGPTAQGIWIVWWADTRAVIKSYEAEVQGTAAESILTVTAALPIFGPLWYGTQEIIRPYRNGASEGATAQTRAMPTDQSRPAAAEPADVDGRVIALVYTTLATWSLLADPPPDIRLHQHPPTSDQQTADRSAGLPSHPITHATMDKAAR
ncbi:hypothetical protein [Actinomadura macra]|uniref:hypothetical protein n=1 Tax=Actinomadura macra TaxID=46164 RepID=UPI00083102AC|nr:hypothetical protein [Actinomadura macra]